MLGLRSKACCLSLVTGFQHNTTGRLTSATFHTLYNDILSYRYLNLKWIFCICVLENLMQLLASVQF